MRLLSSFLLVAFALADTTANPFDDFWTTVEDSTSDVGKATVKTADEVGHNVKEQVGDTVTRNVRDGYVYATDAVRGAGRYVENGYADATGAVRDAGNYVENGVKRGAAVTVDAAGNAVDGGRVIANNARNVRDGVEDATTNAVEKTTDNAMDKVDDALSTTNDYVHGLRFW